MGIHAFTAQLMRPEGVGTWTFLNIPLAVSKSFGSKGQVRIRGKINGHPFRSTALPMGDGTHYLVVGKEIRDQTKARQGDTVKVELELDLEERTVDIPKELIGAFTSQPGAAQAFEKMSYSHQKEWANWITSAKLAETRLRRAEKAAKRIAQWKNLRDR